MTVTNSSQQPPTRDIAIVGLSCRLPRSADPAAYWRTLLDGVNAIDTVPRSRWNIEDYYDPQPAQPGKMQTRWGGFLEQVDQFDAGFFRISPREAKSMDPQQRLLLEVAWEALEDAGQPHEQLEHSATGVFIGICGSEYAMLSGNEQNFSSLDKYYATGTALSVAAGRIAYFLNLHGPALAIETACSSSLVAIHQAVLSLRAAETNLCLVGGVNVVLSPAVGVYFSQIGAVSNSPECKAFDAAADGYVRGEGCGVIVLKRLRDAVANGDRVLAVIKGSAVNHDGRSAGLTAPNGAAQERVLRAALQDGGVDPCDVDYIEAHGTGTRLGDPIEVNAIGKVYGARRTSARPVLIGSVKANLGHLEAAAGVAGLIKTVLAMQHRQIPPQINLRTLNPLIPWNELNVDVATVPMAWRTPARPLNAAVSSFGFSGTNAHVILASHEAASAESAPCRLGMLALPVSARSPAALRELLKAAAARIARIEDGATESIDAICRGWAVRRGHHAYRACAIGSNGAELLQSLEARLAQSQDSTSDGAESGGRLAFVFSGQGSQWPGMGIACLQMEAAAEALHTIDTIVRDAAGWSLLDELTAPDRSRPAQEDAHVTQVCIFAVQVALARQWLALGITPDAVVGHSLGEIAAAHIAGILDLEQATHLSVLRSRLLAQASGLGLMAVADLPRDLAREFADRSAGDIVIAGSNSYSSTVFSGTTAAIRSLLATLQSQAIFCRELRTGGVPGHHPMLAPLARQLSEQAAALRPADGSMDFGSSVEAGIVAGRMLTGDYWARNLLQEVRFAEATAGLLEKRYTLFLEIAPKAVLLPSIEQVATSRGVKCTAVGTLHPERPHREMLAGALATLYSAGCRVDWQAIYPGIGRWEAPAKYPWQRQHHWVSELASVHAERAASPAAPVDAEASLARCIRQWDSFGVRSINMPNLAPWVLLTPDGEAAFYINVTQSICIVWCYLGAADRFAAHVGWLDAQCTRNGLQLMLIADDAASKYLQQLALEALPIGLSHRIAPLSDFTLDGAPMRRLRAQVLRYQRDGGGDTVEYVPGSDPSTDAAVANLIDQWMALKRRPIPAASWLKRQIMRGAALGPRRLFITGSKHQPQSVVLITACGDGRGYLLDMEFYGKHAAAGCNEFALAQIVAKLTAEGCESFSLGGSYGLQDSADAAAEPLLDSYARQLRFKRKFRACETSIVLYCKRASGNALEHLLSILAGDASAPFGSEPQLCTALGKMCAAMNIVNPHHERPHPLLHRQLEVAGPSTIFETQLAAADPLIDQHRIEDQAVVPGTFFIEMATAAARLTNGSARCCLQDVTLVAPLRLAQGETRRVQVVLTPDATGGAEFGIYSWEDSQRSGWTRHASGRAQGIVQCEPLTLLRDGPDWLEVDVESFYHSLATAGIHYGAAYRAVRRLRRCGSEVEAQLDLSHAGAEAADHWMIDPVLLDASLQVLSATGSGDFDTPVMLHSIEQVCIQSPLRGRCVVRARMKPQLGGAELYSGDVDILSAAEEMLVSLRGVIARKAPVHEGRTNVVLDRTARAALHIYEWADTALPARHSMQGQRCVLIGAESTLMKALRADLMQRENTVHCAGTDLAAGIDALQGMPADQWQDLRHLILLPDDTHKGRAAHANATAFPDLLRLLSDRTSSPLYLWAVTRAVHHPAEHCVATDDAAVAGLLRVVQAEHPEWRCGLIDLHPAIAPAAAATAISAVVAAAATDDQWLITPECPKTLRLRRDLGAATKQWSIDSRATYLVTGWSGGVGAVLTRWLIERGARNLVLVARRPGSTARMLEVEACARTHEAILTFAQLDVADVDAVAALFRDLARRPAPLRGIFHAAGQVNDSLLVRQTKGQFEAALAAKIAGTWNLHRASLGLELEAFVLFSSAVTLFAPPSQGAHAAANAAMDYIARYRHAVGLPAISIGWGAWSQVGKAAELRLDERLAEFGLRSISPQAALQALHVLLQRGAAHAFVIDVDWTLWRTSSAGRAPLFSNLGSSGGDMGTAQVSALPDTVQVAADDEAALLQRLMNAIARTLMIEVDAINPQRSLEQNGLDSIMTVELRERLGRELGAPLPLIDFFREPSVLSLSRRASAHLRRRAG